MRQSMVLAGLATVVVVVAAQNVTDVLVAATAMDLISPAIVPFPEYFDSNYTTAFCAYPVSGNYGLLPRILYYCTLVFALLAHNHLWLVAGALASSLTYSGVAAIHACLLVWQGQGLGEMDLDALTAILIPACLITVPLLNWSSTLRKLGAHTDRMMGRAGATPRATPRSSSDAERSVDRTFETHTDQEAARRAQRKAKHAEEQSSAGTRTIVIYWAVLVTVGMLAVCLSTIFCTTLPGVADKAICARLPVGNAPIEPTVESVICAAGTNTTVPIIEPDFVRHNNCTNPCQSDNFAALFRRIDALVLLDRTQARRATGNTFDFLDSRVSPKERKQNAFIYGMHISTLAGVPYAILQGLWAVCFGRREPQEVRDLLYLTFTSPRVLKHIRPSARPIWSGLIKWYCLIVYLGAVVVALICAPLFIMCIIANEFTLSLDPASEPAYNIGQWSPFAVVGLVLVAALIGSYHHSVITILRASWRSHTSKANRSRPITSHMPRPFDRHPSKRTRTTTSPRRDTDLPVDTQVPTISAAIFIAISKVLHFFWDPLRNSVRKIVHRLHGEFGNLGRWFRDPAGMSEKTGRHPHHKKDDDPPRKHLAVVDDEVLEKAPRRTQESGRSWQGGDEEGGFDRHMTVRYQPRSKTGLGASHLRAKSVDSVERRRDSRTW
ncbi:MAG: hypothetical protein M1817_003687 [Caeruleum heppii]|nr:MAG: hypothetical protein M1817_003687 [Caeruleum heppii]